MRFADLTTFKKSSNLIIFVSVKKKCSFFQDLLCLQDIVSLLDQRLLKTSEKSFVQWVLTHCAMKNACYNGLKPIGMGIFLSFLEEI